MQSLFNEEEPAHLANRALQDRVKRVIEPLIPPDAEDRVSRSFKQWNQIIREHIRNETALKLSDGDGRNSIQVRVVEGFPIPLARLIDSYGEPELWQIIVGQRRIGGIIEGLQFLLRDWSAFENWKRLPPEAKGAEPHFARTLEVAGLLQQLSIADEVRKKLQEIETDILGVYRFAAGMASQVDLYWMPIAMLAAMLDIRIEDLTIVVLAHELAHGYTHIGRDIDGTQWSDEGFSKTDLNIVEGLAQFYTEVVANRISNRLPGVLLAYERLLELQSEPYLAHLRWVNNDAQQRGETIRFAMISARSRGVVSPHDWKAFLDGTQNTLRQSRGRKN